MADSRRIGYIDGLRALAVVAVIVCHDALFTPGWQDVLAHPRSVHLAALAHALVDGSHGVDLFFVLSGFCLAYPTLVRIDAEGFTAFDLVRYGTQRIGRILPPYYAATLLMLLVAAIFAVHNGTFAVPGSATYSPQDILGQLTLLDRGVVMSTPPFWTLAVEWRWYLLFPLLLAVWVRTRRAYVALVVAVVVAYWCTRLHNLDLGVLPAFMLGIIAADLALHRAHPVIRFAPLGVALAIPIALLLEPHVSMPNALGVDEPYFLWQTNPGWHVAAFFFVICGGTLPWLRRCLELPWVMSVGRASYSIYLVHYPIVAFVNGHLMSKLPEVAAFVISAAAAIAGGYAFFLMVERPLCSGEGRQRVGSWVEPVVASAFRWLQMPARLRITNLIVPPVRKNHLHLAPGSMIASVGRLSRSNRTAGRAAKERPERAPAARQ